MPAVATKPRAKPSVPDRVELHDRHVMEFIDRAGPRVDREKGIVFGVKVVGRRSPNAHKVEGADSTEYTLEALQRALPQYNCNVNVDHPDREKPHKDRSAQDRFAWIEEARATDDGIFGDLHFLDPSDPLAIRVMNAAEKRPEAFALSHNAFGRGKVQDRKYIVTEIPEVRSVDLVADGGTNRSLFESNQPANKPEVKVATITLRKLMESFDKGKQKRKLRRAAQCPQALGRRRLWRHADGGAARGRRGRGAAR